jgi:hypothetical protein
MSATVRVGLKTWSTRTFWRNGPLCVVPLPRTDDTANPPVPITVNKADGLPTRLSTPTIGIPFTRPERERRLDMSATSMNE